MQTTVITSKRCSECKEEKSSTSFGRYKRTKDGLRGKCKECRKLEKQDLEYKKQWYLANKPKHLQTGKRWVENNIERVKEYKSQWAKENYDRIYTKQINKLKEKQIEKYQNIIQNDTGEKELIGTKINNWVIKAHSPPSENYICECICGNLELMGLNELILGYYKSCSKCQDQNYDGIIPMRYMTVLIHGARERKLEWNITVEDIENQWHKQSGLCALTGVVLILDKNNKYMTASLDRIDSSKGYIIDNIQWIDKDVNVLKNNYNEEYFKHICFMVTQQDLKKKEDQ